MERPVYVRIRAGAILKSTKKIVAKILVVDDEPMVVTMCASILKLGHHDIFQTSNPHQALGLADASSPELALLDIMMPEMNGLVLAEHLRARHPQIKILLMTGFRPDEIAEISGKENPHRIIWKPFKIESLLRMVDNALEEPRISMDRQ
jgi:DNA-binding NtrC family response regulator